MRKGAPWLKTTPDPVRLGGRPQKRQLSPGAVPSLALSARQQKGDRRPRRLDPHRRLPYAQGRHPLSRSRSRPLRPPGQNRADQAPPHASPKTRLCRPNNPPGGVTRDLFLSRIEGSGRIPIRLGERFFLQPSGVTLLRQQNGNAPATLCSTNRIG